MTRGVQILQIKWANSGNKAAEKFLKTANKMGKLALEWTDFWTFWACLFFPVTDISLEAGHLLSWVTSCFIDGDRYVNVQFSDEEPKFLSNQEPNYQFKKQQISKYMKNLENRKKSPKKGQIGK